MWRHEGQFPKGMAGKLYVTSPVLTYAFNCFQAQFCSKKIGIHVVTGKIWTQSCAAACPAVDQGAFLCACL